MIKKLEIFLPLTSLVCFSCLNRQDRHDPMQDGSHQESLDLAARATTEYWEKRSESTASFRKSDRRVIFDPGEYIVHEMEIGRAHV